jgi:hypothetical protein
MRSAWTHSGWTGTLLLVGTLAELAFPAARRHPVLIFVSASASMLLCVSAGISHKRWFLVPSVLALVLAVCLTVSVFSE